MGWDGLSVGSVAEPCSGHGVGVRAILQTNLCRYGTHGALRGVVFLGAPGAPGLQRDRTATPSRRGSDHYGLRTLLPQLFACALPSKPGWLQRERGGEVKQLTDDAAQSHARIACPALPPPGHRPSARSPRPPLSPLIGVSVRVWTLLTEAASRAYPRPRRPRRPRWPCSRAQGPRIPGYLERVSHWGGVRKDTPIDRPSSATT